MSVENKTCLVSGATSGIGKYMAYDFAQRQAQLILTGRNPEKLTHVQQTLQEETGNTNIYTATADFAELKAVHQLAQWVQQEFSDLHLLVNNAGIFSSSRDITSDGHEKVFQVNYLAHFLLTYKLLDLLKSSAPARIVNISSGMHRMGKINFDDLTLENGYNGIRAYGRSKLAGLLFTYELARRLPKEEVVVHAANPGPVSTDFASKHSRGLYWLFWRIYRYFIKGIKKGAETPIYVATHPELQEVTGRYYRNKREKKTAKATYDKELARQLWKKSKELTGITDR